VNALFSVQSSIVLVATLVIFVLQAWAFVDAVSHRPDAYPAADKLTKRAWLSILGLALAASLLSWFGLLAMLGFIGSMLYIASIIAAIVYLVDVRPALRGLTRRR
jgi:hypothetical protein